MTNKIDPKTKIGYVHLTISDFGVSLPFYQEVLGFQVHRQDGDTAYLGAGHEDLVVLTENPQARPPARATGLYHFAILVPSRRELAHSLRQLAETRAPVQGFSDHGVSEALYLADPDGNGIEVYRDRPQTDWYDARGRFRMGTDPLDVRGVLSELEQDGGIWKGLHPDTLIGHMHLQVAQVQSAEAFYREVLGMDVMINMRTASFMSAGGYHHHIGMNVWNSACAPPPPPDSIGLRYFTVQLSDAQAVGRIADNVHNAGLKVQETEQGLLVHDPSRNGIVLTTVPERQNIQSR
ncbi:MAG: VOC family protein [Anaerolineae bacterium]